MNKFKKNDDVIVITGKDKGSRGNVLSVLGDQVLVKVLAIEGNKIRLSRKAVLREQREKQQKEAAGT